MHGPAGQYARSPVTGQHPPLRVDVLPGVLGRQLGPEVETAAAEQALRAAYPHAEIVLLGTPVHTALLRGRPAPIDTAFALPTATDVFAAASDAELDADEQSAFFAPVTVAPIDLAVQAHGGGHWSNPFLLRLGARFTIGTRSPDTVELDRWLPSRYLQYEALRWLEVVERWARPARSPHD